MKRFFLLTFFLGIMGIAVADFQDDRSKHALYYSDDCVIKINPEAGPRIDGDWNVFVTADFIYWTVRQDGMFYAITGVGTNPSKGGVHDLNWNWDPGFKVGLGCNLPHDGWDLFAEYTWMQSHPSGSKTQEAASSTMIPYWNVTGMDAGTLVRAKADWDVHYNNVTLDLGRNTYLSQYMKLRLFAGLQGAWINQDYKAQFDLDTLAYGRMKLSQNFWGIGLRAGLNNSFQFTKNFSFFADLYLALLWGKFDLDRTDSTRASDAGVTIKTLKTGVRPWTEEPVVDIAAGFRYDGWFSEDRFHFLLQAGWEHQLWILHNQMLKATESNHAGDLLLQGLTIKARLDF